MARKFTRSKDGIDRCNVKISVRLTREELDALKEIANRTDQKIEQVLSYSARDVIYAAFESEEDDQS